MDTLDFLVVGAYFLLIFTVAFYVTRKERKEKSSDAYFLGGKNSGWFVIGASLFASNIGSEHLIGLAGSGARGDFVNGQFEILAALILLLLGWVFVPFYIKSGVFTMPEFLEKRYSRGARRYLSVISILAYVLTKISVTIFAGALVFEQLLGIDFWTGAVLVVIATGVYTIFGGLKAVVYTDMVQMFVLVGGAIAVTAFGIDQLGGWDAMMTSITADVGDSKATDYLSLWRPNTDTNYPWTGILFGAPILGVWYWCTDQFIVQRVLSAKDPANARQGTIFAGFLKLLPIFLFVLPGVVAFGLFTQDGTLLLGEDGEILYDAALPAMVANYLPVGLKGLVAAGLLAALMSSLSSVFNSCSTLVTMDFFKIWNPDLSERRLVYIGQVSTAVLVVIGLAWIPLMENMMSDGGLFKYLQSIQAYISPPIAAVFLFGILTPAVNHRGAILALWTGFVVGCVRLALEFMTATDAAGNAILSVQKGGLIDSFVSINFLHFALILFFISSIVHFVGSRGVQHDRQAILYLTMADRNKEFMKQPAVKRDLLLTMILVALVIILWVMFSPIGIA
ncbi:MAG: sodium:solute symporter [Flavobacteriales bacterium]|nr:sodium:solute symporter [Flavobacteriales bacterium]